VLATNTSALPITQIAAVTERPESVVGTHFFSPVPMMALCELVRGYKTSDETLARARAFAEGVGKTCIVVNRDVAGFVTTRLIAALVNEAVRLLRQGVATAEDIDTACKLGFGHAMGPLATVDLTGVDIMRNASRNIYNESHRTTSSRCPSCSTGWSRPGTWAARAAGASTTTESTKRRKAAWRARKHRAPIEGHPP
jgi:3-hydroxybutyryl-CoA dehydrogenase